MCVWGGGGGRRKGNMPLDSHPSSPSFTNLGRHVHSIFTLKLSFSASPLPPPHLPFYSHLLYMKKLIQPCVSDPSICTGHYFHLHKSLGHYFYLHRSQSHYFHLHRSLISSAVDELRVQETRCSASDNVSLLTKWRSCYMTWHCVFDVRDVKIAVTSVSRLRP